MEIKILEKSEAMFLKYGIKSVTMDDIARDLGISKKTLYKFVDNKADLIEKILTNKIQDEQNFIKQASVEAKDAIEAIVMIARYITVHLSQIPPTAIYDLKKYYRAQWKLLEDYHQEYIYGMIKNNAKRGIEEGVYREDINIDIISRLYVGKTMLITDEEMFPATEFSKEKLFNEYILYHIHGIASKKGLSLLKKYLK